jgi:hypothetical protein
MSAAANAFRYVYMSFAGLPPASASIYSAILSLKIGPGWNGNTVYIRRITERWAESSLNWSNKPATSSVHLVTVTGVSGADGTEVQFDVTALVKDMLAAGQRFGFRLETSNASLPGRPFYSSEAGKAAYRPTLTIDWTTAPTVATDLWPSGGDAVSLAAPWVGWTYRDLQGDAQQSFRIQLATDTTFSAPTFDSGTVASADPQADLAALGYAGLALNATIYWRVQVADSYGNLSPWSDPATWIRKAKGTLVINTPGATVDSDSPTVNHTFTPPAGAAQQSVRYRVEELVSGAYVLRYDSGRRVTTATAYEIPAGYIKKDGATHRLTVDVWDNIVRAGTPGDLPQVTAQLVFTFSPSVGTVPTGVTAATEAGGGPGVVLTWSRAAAPDSFVVYVDGVVVASRLDPVACSIGGTNYSWTYYGADGWLAHDFRVAAGVINAGVWSFSPKSTPATILTPQPLGVWLVDDQSSPVVKVQLLGIDAPELALAESSSVYTPVGRPDPVIVRDSMRGIEGSISGTVSAPADYDNLAAMVANNRVVRYVVGRLNVPVRIRALTYDPLPLDSSLTNVSLEAYQVGEFT